jgi:hypothetical protein
MVLALPTLVGLVQLTIVFSRKNHAALAGMAWFFRYRSVSVLFPAEIMN